MSRAGDAFDLVILGGGFGGLEVARHLARLRAGARVALVNPSPVFVYRPWLIFLPPGRKDRRDLEMSLERAAPALEVELALGSASRVDLDRRRVELSDGSALRFRAVLVAAGARADRDWIPGAREHALFPCEDADAHRLAEAFAGLERGTVTVVIGGERPGPGLEYAGWMARAAGERLGVRVRVVDGQPGLMGHLGPEASEALREVAEASGAEVVTGSAVEAVGPGEVRLAGGRVLESDVTAVVGPLLGVDLELPSPLADERGFVRVDAYLRSPNDGALFAVGDAAAVAAERPLPKSWIVARMQAKVAAGNIAAALSGGRARPLDLPRIMRFAIALPDVGGRTALIRPPKVVARGRAPLAIRAALDRSFLARYRRFR